MGKFKRQFHIHKLFSEDFIEHLLKSACFLGMLVCLAWGLAAVIGENVSTAAGAAKKALPIYCVQTDKPQIAISFDASWGNEHTRSLLDILASEDIKATFFITGTWIDKYPEDVLAVVAAGHDLGNHSQSHKHMPQLSVEEQSKEILLVHDKVKALTGIDMNLFRHPFGDYDNTVLNTLANMNYYAIQWDVDSLDWKDYDAETLVKKVTLHKNLGNGSIILCHNNGKYTAEALPEIIRILKEEGYEFVPISQLIYKSGYTIDSTGRQTPV